MGGGIIMVFDFGLSKEEEEELKNFKVEKKYGTPKAPTRLDLFNKHNKKYGIEPITSIKFYNNFDRYNLETEAVKEQIFNTILFCKEVFGIELGEKEAATISCQMFDIYYATGDKKIDKKIELYNRALTTLKMAHNISDAKLIATIETLELLGIEMPQEIIWTKAIKEKYGKNQKKKAIIHFLKTVFPEITTKYILERIATNSLK